ncbi:MAG: hypothetical protein K2H39_03705, partial [Paramuribaculum sp.]|nr:hypothetical protein [Paramuribaculum sp.]
NHSFAYWTLNGVITNDAEILIYSDPEEADIIAYFKSAYPVTFTSPANGIISVKDSENNDIVSGQRIAENNTVKIQLTPANGYRVTSVLVNNVEISHSSDPINYKVTEPITISGKVEAAAAGTKLITVISSDNSMGKAYINTPGVTSMSISYNGSAELHAEPAMGCKFEGWRQVGTNNFISTDPVYTFYYAASDIHMEAVFNYIIQTPREVTVVSSNSGKGTVKIKDESTTIVTSQRYLTLIATPNTENDFFIDWTNESGKVLSTKNEYIYDNEAPAIITANFKSKYTLDYSVEGEAANTVMVIVDDGSELTSGGIIHYSSLVDEGTRIELTIEPVDHYEVSELYVNNKDVATEYYANDCKYTFAINSNIRIKAIIEPQHHSISITEHPHGSISVYKELDVNGNGLGSKLLHGDRTKYGTTLYIFSTPLDSYELESVKINGEKKSAKDGKAYIEHLVDSDVEIIPNFSITTGIDTIHRDNSEDEIIMVFDLSGKYIGKALPKTHGIYIVKTMTKTLKVKI